MQEINMLIFISLNICGIFCNYLTLKRARAQKITKARARARARAQPFFGPKSVSASAANFDERTKALDTVMKGVPKVTVFNRMVRPLSVKKVY